MLNYYRFNDYFYNGLFIYNFPVSLFLSGISAILIQCSSLQDYIPIFIRIFSSVGLVLAFICHFTFHRNEYYLYLNHGLDYKALVTISILENSALSLSFCYLYYQYFGGQL